jgi:hypothetical protein
MRNTRHSKKIMFPENVAHEKIRQLLSDHAGYVLVTCRPPNRKGKMEVEVSYDGDIDLASYLVDGAQGYLEQEQGLVEHDHS